MNKYPFGNTEKEHNDFCDTLKCKYGNYCNCILGLCPLCKEELEKRRIERNETL